MADVLQLARAASDAALATEGVYRLGTGRFVEAATYGAGEKINGVVVTPEKVQVHIVALYPLDKPIPELAQEVRERVIPEIEGREADVVVEDLEVAEE
ncbi:MAG: hypothetical protein ACFB50_09635 [Rubrobacteraceae bacterium]